MRFFALVLLLLPVLASATIVDEVAEETVSKRPGGADRPMASVDLQMVQKAFDLSGPRDNTVHFRFHPDSTYKLRLREFMDTTIVLPEGERIKSFSLGESTNFTFVPFTEDGTTMGNLAKVFATYPGADTNLTIIGNTGRVYSFYLRSDSVRSPHLPHLVAYVDDPDFKIEPGGSNTRKGPIAPEKQHEDDPEYLRSLGLVNPETLEYDYEVVSGDGRLAPVRVFSDGHMTYFQFNAKNLDKVHRLPAVYRVVDGHDSPANTRVVGGTVIAETVSDKWTLRNGDAHLCIHRKE